ncbi:MULTISPECIES: ATP-binding protein [Streptomyces]|uniref:ATP-binding protein n=1 Tax=Streptomyces ramulosus TaxID=47762 RepID=A0ABW1FMP6_9ACTN
MPDPKTAGNSGAVRALQRIIDGRGIRLSIAELSDEVAPGDPTWHRDARAAAALSRWEAATPPRFRDAEATIPDVIAWADAALSDPSSAGALLLTGPTGTGKTYQGYGALRRVAAGGPAQYEVVALNSADMYGGLRPTREVGASERELRRLSQVPFLFLDDLGTSKVSEWTEEVTYRLINYRYNHVLPTVITSNLPARDDTGPDLSDFVGARVASRLAEMVTTLVPVIGADRRRGAA